jgi:hypothetical protein
LHIVRPDSLDYYFEVLVPVLISLKTRPSERMSFFISDYLIAFIL